MNIKEDSIIIVEDSTKENFIKDFRRSHPLFAVTILGLDEFKKRYYFDYSKEAVFYVHKKYDVIKEIAEIYLQNIYYIMDSVTEPKVDFLKSIKRDLDEHGLLKYDCQFKKHLKDKNIYLYNLSSVDNFYTRMFAELEECSHIIILNDENDSDTLKPLYKLPNREEEVAFVATQIADLLKSGTSIDDIKIANVSGEYIFPLKRTFKDFHIPIEIHDDKTIAGTLIVSKFKEFYNSDISVTLHALEPFIKTENDEYIFKKILSILNEYYWCDNYMEVKDFIIADLAKVKVKSTTYKHAVKTIDFMMDKIEPKDHVFLINFNQGIIPINKKDEDYLNDKTKIILGLSDSIDLNKKRISKVRKLIKTTNHLVVTYSARDLGGELYISNAYDESLFTNASAEINFEHSDAYNRKVLLRAKDENKKYGSTSPTLEKLLNHYQNEPYGTFDNSFKGIDKSSLKEYLKDGLTLSYSSMNDFYKCSFRYYLSYILKVDKFEDSFATIIGSIFHEVLSKCYDETFDFEKSWSKAIEHQNFEFKYMELFYLDLLKEELAFIINNLHYQKALTNLDKALFEQKILVPVDGVDGVVFKGFVDKILYNSKGEQQVAAIIDYKTGTPELNIDDVVYGLDMQLPIYAYLLKHYAPLQNAAIGGFYLQKILNGKKDIEAKAKALRLQGYSNSNPRILGFVDKNYEDSSLIKSMKMSKGNFYSYAKVLTDDQIAKMISIVEEKIKYAAQNILDGNFNIDPKEIGGDNKGCLYCKFKDICYVKNRDIRKLKKMKKEEFLGGEENGLD